MKELMSSTGTVQDLSWVISGNTYPGIYYHKFLPDIMDHQEYSLFLYKITIDTTGVWDSYTRHVYAQPDSSDGRVVLDTRFQPNEKVSFTALIYGGREYGSTYTQDYGNTDYYRAAFITTLSLVAMFGSNYMYHYELADVIDNTVPLSRTNSTGLYFTFDFSDSTVNYNQSFQTSYYLYGIV